MRNSVQKFVDAVRAYLEKAFSERVEKLNGMDPSPEMQDIASWSTGFRGVLAGLEEYPGCLLLVGGRTLDDCYTTSFTLSIGIAVTSDDPGRLEMLGGLWEDILEDTIRSDWHLGGACLDIAPGMQIRSDCTSGVYVIEADLTCQVDLGGFVYGKED